MKNETQITSAGIKKVLKNYKPTQAFAEYIWNGFDANASEVNIDYECTELGRIEALSISDNGLGINTGKLNEKFGRFYDSEKIIVITSPTNTSLMHGKNGVGRLTFFKFAEVAEWNTTYLDGTLKAGRVIINSSNLKGYTSSEFPATSTCTGTTVKFYDLILNCHDLEQEIIPYIKREFCWFLELNKEKKYKIQVNGKPIGYEDLVLNQESFKLEHNSVLFEIKYVHWDKYLNKELSKFYFQKSNGEEVYKDFTTLNRKADHFFHSVFIKSDFFDMFDTKTSIDSTQTDLFGKAKGTSEYRFLIQEINEFLRQKRRPFLRMYAQQLVEEYEQAGIFPDYKNSWELVRKNELKETIIGLYEVQPKVFVDLNVEQKKTFVRFLDLLLDSNERENIFNILGEITDIEPEDREELSNLFRATKLNHIISAIKLIQDRYKVFYQVKELVYNTDLKANEVDHLQSIVESHYWLFGEQYHLVTAAEPKFEEALRRYIYLLRGENKEIHIDHIHKKKEMDIFACRQNKYTDRIENIVIELKHPNILLGRDQYNQVDKYLEVILSQPEFNAKNMDWKFYLVGKKFDNSKFLERQIETNRNHGEKSLVLSNDNGRVRVYAKLWSEIFADFELRHSFIEEKLQLERTNLISSAKSADEIIENAKISSAVQDGEVVISK